MTDETEASRVKLVLLAERRARAAPEHLVFLVRGTARNREDRRRRWCADSARLAELFRQCWPVLEKIRLL